MGKTSTDVFKKRWPDHKSAARKGGKYYLYNAIRKYGEDNFIVDILATTSTEQEANNLEKVWILLLKSHDEKFGYNLTLGGEGQCGAIVSEEQRRKHSEKLKGRFVGEKAYWYGKKRPDISEPLRRANLGKKQTPETLEKKRENGNRLIQDPEYMAKLQQAGRDLWKDSVYVEKVMAARKEAKNRKLLEEAI